MQAVRSEIASQRTHASRQPSFRGDTIIQKDEPYSNRVIRTAPASIVRRLLHALRVRPLAAALFSADYSVGKRTLVKNV